MGYIFKKENFKVFLEFAISPKFNHKSFENFAEEIVTGFIQRNGTFEAYLVMIFKIFTIPYMKISPRN